MYFGYGINHDPRIFPDHDNFRPERFLDGDRVFRKDDRVVLFGVGKRRCPGEILARAEIFLLLASIVQAIRLRPVPGAKLDQDPIPGLVFYPGEFQVIPEPRN